VNDVMPVQSPGVRVAMAPTIEPSLSARVTADPEFGVNT
jgi:hypothetical protein